MVESNTFQKLKAVTEKDPRGFSVMLTSRARVDNAVRCKRTIKVMRTSGRVRGWLTNRM